MIALYLCAIIPILAWFIAWLRFDKVNVWEFVIPSAVTFIIAGIVHFSSFKSQTGDTEYWSGQIVQARQFSEWQEYYEEAIYRTEYYWTTETYTERDSKGKSRTKTRRVQKSRRVFDHWEPRTRWHSQHYSAYSNIDTSYGISEGTYRDWAGKLGGDHKVKGDRTTMEHNSRMIGGKDYDLVADNKTGFIIPVTKEMSFTNRLKAKKSIWSYSEPPKGISIPDRPVNNDPFKSNRLIGTAKDFFSVRALDDLNAVLGPAKQIDLVIVGFDSDDEKMSNYLESKWNGGTKNQLVITFGTKWVRVFGWSKSDTCKLNIESLFLKEKKDDALLQKVKAEILSNYQRRNWHDFDHLSIEPGGWAWFWFIFISLLAHGGAVYFAITNGCDKFDNPFDNLIKKNDSA